MGPYLVAEALEGPLPTVIISALEPQEAYVTVTKDDGGSVSFKATVTVDKPPIGTVMVQIDGATSTGWPVVVTPQSIPFTKSGDVDINITVTVPQATPCTNIGNVLVNVMASYPGGSTTAQSGGTVKVHQYFDAIVKNDPSIGVENPQHFNILVKNNGNGQDTFEISLPFNALDRKNGISIDIQKPRTGLLEIDGNESLEVVAKYGPTAPVGSYKFIVCVTSLGSVNSGNNTFSANYPIIIKVSPVTGQSGVTVSMITIAVLIVVGIVAFIVYKKRKGKRFFKAKETATSSPDNTDEK
jgi:hypothetical protein